MYKSTSTPCFISFLSTIFYLIKFLSSSFCRDSFRLLLQRPIQFQPRLESSAPILQRSNQHRRSGGKHLFHSCFSPCSPHGRSFILQMPLDFFCRLFEYSIFPVKIPNSFLVLDSIISNQLRRNYYFVFQLQGINRCFVNAPTGVWTHNNQGINSPFL